MGSRVRRMRVGRSVLVVATIGAALVAPASPALAQDTPPGWQVKLDCSLSLRLYLTQGILHNG